MCFTFVFVQNLIFRFLQNKSRVQVWLYDNSDMRIEGRIIGFDEYMNLVLDAAEEVHVKRKLRKELGRILLKVRTSVLRFGTHVMLISDNF